MRSAQGDKRLLPGQARFLAIREKAVGKRDTLVIHEMYQSIQGESSFAGLPCTFVRTTGCNLRCAWCDTPQAFRGGTRWRREDVLVRALSFGTTLVELTGGEPLLQPGVFPLMAELCDAGRTVLVETSGEADVSPVDARVHKVMDLKCPASGESHRNRWSNLAYITPRDEIKFVVADRADYTWTRAVIAERRLWEHTPNLLVSAAFGRLAPKDLVRWVLEDRLAVRVQLQMHKYVWAPDATGV